jgi:microcystin-dependent protein
LPDLRGRTPVGPRRGPGLSAYTLGERGGVEDVTLNLLQLPSHTHMSTNNSATDQHILLSNANAVNEDPAPGDVPAVANYTAGVATQKVKSFAAPTGGTLVNGQALSGSAGLTLGNTGGNQSHENRQPFIAVNYIIAMFGLYPSRS